MTNRESAIRSWNQSRNLVVLINLTRIFIYGRLAGGNNRSGCPTSTSLI